MARRIEQGSNRCYFTFLLLLDKQNSKVISFFLFSSEYPATEETEEFASTQLQAGTQDQGAVVWEAAVGAALLSQGSTAAGPQAAVVTEQWGQLGKE